MKNKAFLSSLLGLILLVGLGGLVLMLALNLETEGFQDRHTLNQTPGIDSGLEGYPWLYQREAFHQAPEETYELILVGDVLSGRITSGDQAEERGNLEREAALQLPAALQEADLLVGNLEGVIQRDFNAIPFPDPTREAFTLAGSPDRTHSPADAGFDLFSLANNHALDLGGEGLAATARFLDQRGVGAFGAGANPQEAKQPILRQLGGLRAAFLGVTAVQNPGESGAEEPGEAGWGPAVWSEQFLEAVRRAKQETDLVVVMVHWGYEYQPRQDPRQQKMAQQLLEAGADLVVGAHPHVVQGVEVVTGGEGGVQIVAYSLGNFIFDQSDPGTDQGLALRVVLDDQGILGVQALPIAASPQPALLPPEAAVALLEKLRQPTAPAVFACGAESCSQVEAADLSQRQIEGGIFWSASSDLTGDGQPELVRRENQQVVVYEGGVETWRTPSSWQILDAALGDPDWDGRNDILLAMLKPDAQGVLRSHPFIMGYRGGMYRNLWGGSAVSDPILEIELGNLDGSLPPELVVLEEREGGLRAVTVWDWHGWGFSLRWRSPEGAYENLRLARDAGSGADWIVVDYR